MRLTIQGKFLLLICAALYIASLTSQSGLLLLPIGLLLGCYVVNFWAARAGIAGLELEVPLHAHTTEGRRLEEPWRVVNHCPRGASFITGESSAGPLFRLAVIGSNSAVTVTPALSLPRRGVYPHTEIKLGSTFPFGLLKVARPVALPGEVLVYPALYAAAAPRAAGMDPVVGGKHSGQRRTLSGGDFAGIRPMRGGDPLKHIHWKSSSKGRGLMVKTFQEELSGRIGFIVDCGHAGDATALDDCLRAAGSLMFAALDAGHHLEWVDLENGAAELFPPFTEGQEILDRLARLQIEPNCLVAERLNAAVGLVSRKSAICFVVTTVNDLVRAVVNELLRQQRTVSLYLPVTVANHEPWDCPVFFYSDKEILDGPP